MSRILNTASKRSSRNNLYEFILGELALTPTGANLLSVGSGGEIEELVRRVTRDTNGRLVTIDITADRGPDIVCDICEATFRDEFDVSLRPDSRGGHHVLALQTLHTSIGYPREKLRLPDEFRRQRATGLYDGSFVPKLAELDELRATAAKLKAHLEAWLTKHHPELSTVNSGGTPRSYYGCQYT